MTYYSVYLVGVTDAIINRLFDQIAEVLKTLDIKLRADSRSDNYESPMVELQHELHFYALAFMLGHEFGHIKLGHIDQQLSLRQMIDEKSLSASYLQEAEADTIGAISVLNGMEFLMMKRRTLRLIELTDATTALGLIQVPIACIFASLFSANTSKEFTEAYPYPIVRLFHTGWLLIRFMSMLMNHYIGSDVESTRSGAQLFMGTILKLSFPAVDNAVHAESEELGRKIKDLQNATNWILRDWVNI